MPAWKAEGDSLAYSDLREWIKTLERAGELRRVRAEVDPVLEIAEITDRVSKAGRLNPHHRELERIAPGGPAILFENIKGHPGHKVLINQFGSARRMNLALKVDALDEISDRIRVFMDVKSPHGLLDKIKMLPMLAELGQIFPEGSRDRSLQRSDPAGRILGSRLSGPAVLAERWRALHHAAVCDYARSENREAQRRDVPHAGV